MTDFAGAGVDWDLRAVVRGCNASLDYPHTCFSPLITHHQDNIDINDDLIFGNFVFPQYLFDSASAAASSDLELEDLYKPFYPPSGHPLSPPSSEKLVSPDEEKLQPAPGQVGTAEDCPKTAGAKYRRRKNQHKRVVMEVTAEDLSSDMWAWRKYGQKPIKGSPYPRSYYRCSSSRGCPARKQVERSQSDPSTFVMTYTAEHNHSKPTRRNSLAGTTRQRFSSVSATKTCVSQLPTEDEYFKKTGMRRERGGKETETTKTDAERYMEEVVISDDMMIMSDDFLADFEEQLKALTPSDLGFNEEDSGSSSFW